MWQQLQGFKNFSALPAMLMCNSAQHILQHCYLQTNLFCSPSVVQQTICAAIAYVQHTYPLPVVVIAAQYVTVCQAVLAHCR